MKIHVIDNWASLKKDVYIYERLPGRVIVLQHNGTYIEYPEGQSFEGSPTFTIDYAWLDDLITELLAQRKDKSVDTFMQETVEYERYVINRLLDKVVGE